MVVTKEACTAREQELCGRSPQNTHRVRQAVRTLRAGGPGMYAWLGGFVGLRGHTYSKPYKAGCTGEGIVSVPRY